jgi:hypothetical protein
VSLDRSLSTQEDAEGAIPVSPWLRFFILLLPFLVWLGMHNWGVITPIDDNGPYASWVTYHFDYLSKGIFPLWDPFHNWGWPNITDTRFIGEFNPFYLIVSLLLMFNVTEVMAFNIFLIVIHLLGGVGFYLLVRALWEDEFLGLLAYCMYMFSMLGAILFSQLGVALLLVPTIWFFFFLLKFMILDDPKDQKRYFWGLIFTIAIIFITYLPLFFIIVLGAFILAIGLTCPGMFSRFLKKIIQFAKHRPVASLTGLSITILSCLPGVFWFISSLRGDIVVLNDRNGFGQAKGADVPLAKIQQSGLASQTSWGEIFSDQNFVVHGCAYVPAFLVGILALSLFTRMNSRQRIIFLASFFIFAFALAGVTPIHGFLYEHVFFIRMVRNLFFFGPFLLLMLTALGVSQIKVLMRTRPRNIFQRSGCLFLIWMVHAIFLYILLRQEPVLWSVYATFIGSAVLCSAHVLGMFDRRPAWFLGALICLVALQPGHLMVKLSSVWSSQGMERWEMKDRAFAYTRPLRGEFPENELGWAVTLKKKQDDSGFLKNGFYGTKYAAALFQNISANDLQKYVPHKFLVYDRTSYMDPEAPDWKAAADTLSNMKSSAFVHDKAALNSLPEDNGNTAPLIVSGPSPMLTVTSFNPNHVRIKTDFPHSQFLVYNDSYHPDWAAVINGKKVPVFRANVAFKGIWVDAGPQAVEFRYGSFLQYFFRWALMTLLVFLLSYIVFLFVRKKNAFS